MNVSVNVRRDESYEEYLVRCAAEGDENPLSRESFEKTKWFLEVRRRLDLLKL